MCSVHVWNGINTLRSCVSPTNRRWFLTSHFGSTSVSNICVPSHHGQHGVAYLKVRCFSKSIVRCCSWLSASELWAQLTCFSLIPSIILVVWNKFWHFHRTLCSLAETYSIISYVPNGMRGLHYVTLQLVVQVLVFADYLGRTRQQINQWNQESGGKPNSVETRPDSSGCYIFFVDTFMSSRTLEEAIDSDHVIHFFEFSSLNLNHYHICLASYSQYFSSSCILSWSYNPR